MSEQQTPQKKQNIVRFPTSKKERRKLLQESKDKRVQLVRTLRRACGWLLVIGAFLFVLTNYRLLTPSSLRSLAEYTVAGLRQHEGDITPSTTRTAPFPTARCLKPASPMRTTTRFIWRAPAAWSA